MLGILIPNAVQLKGGNLKKYDFQLNCTKMVNRTFNFKPVFIFWLFLDLNI